MPTGHGISVSISYSSLPPVGTAVKGLGWRKIVVGGNEMGVLEDKLLCIFLGTCFPEIIFSTLMISELQRSFKKSQICFIQILQILNLPHLLYPFPSKYTFFLNHLIINCRYAAPFLQILNVYFFFLFLIASSLKVY